MAHRSEMTRAAGSSDGSAGLEFEMRTRRTPPATAAGLCYLAVIAGGLFAEGLVRAALIVPGDPAATAAAILQNETLWRVGLAVHLLYLIPALAVNVLVSGFFRSTEPTLARLALVFGAAGVTVEAIALVQLYVPLVLMEDGAALSTGDDTAALIYLATRLFATGFSFSLLLFAGFCVLIGVLILRSRLVPRAIGAMMVLAGLCYVVNTLALIVSPEFFKMINPMILLPIVVAELSLALWLLLKGIALAK
jgi:hypothetical protein